MSALDEPADMIVKSPLATTAAKIVPDCDSHPWLSFMRGHLRLRIVIASCRVKALVRSSAAKTASATSLWRRFRDIEPRFFQNSGDGDLPDFRSYPFARKSAAPVLGPVA